MFKLFKLLGFFTLICFSSPSRFPQTFASRRQDAKTFFWPEIQDYIDQTRNNIQKTQKKALKSTLIELVRLVLSSSEELAEYGLGTVLEVYDRNDETYYALKELLWGGFWFSVGFRSLENFRKDVSAPLLNLLFTYKRNLHFVEHDPKEHFLGLFDGDDSLLFEMVDQLEKDCIEKNYFQERGYTFKFIRGFTNPVLSGHIADSIKLAREEAERP